MATSSDYDLYKNPTVPVSEPGTSLTKHPDGNIGTAAKKEQLVNNVDETSANNSVVGLEPVSTAAKALSDTSTFVPLTEKEPKENGLVQDDLGLLINEGLHKQVNLEVFNTRREGHQKQAQVSPEPEASTTTERPALPSPEKGSNWAFHIEPENARPFPTDIWYLIVSRLLNSYDFHCLAQVNRTMRKLLQNDYLAKQCIMNHLPYSKEARLASANMISFRKAISQLYGRREAVSSAKPYSAAIVSYAEQFLYQQGVLCYIHNGYIRVLDIHGAEKTEQIWNIEVLCGITDLLELSLLHYCDGVLAILDSAAWLIVLDITPEGSKQPTGHKQGRVCFKTRLQSTDHFFVRHDGTYLFYGYYWLTSYEQFWDIQGVDLSNMKLTKPAAIEFASPNVGKVCFEMIHSCLYIIYKPEQQSYYDWKCIPPHFDNSMDFPKYRISQSNHLGGPISDRWTVHEDEATGQPMIYEPGVASYIISTHDAQAVRQLGKQNFLMTTKCQPYYSSEWSIMDENNLSESSLYDRILYPEKKLQGRARIWVTSLVMRREISPATGEPIEGSHKQFLWLPEDISQDVLNLFCRGERAHVTAVADERSLVYSIGQAVILLSFDPRIRLLWMHEPGIAKNETRVEDIPVTVPAMYLAIKKGWILSSPTCPN